ncbi:MAG: hypothetical protein KTR32_27065 [Granulosicoccus sp.]|nr:hypothetical protein [Granulosicoccus sp.]
MPANSSVPVNLRLQRLRVAVKLMLLVALGVVVYIIGSAFSSAPNEQPDLPVISIDLNRVPPGGAITINWADRPVLILRRTPAEIQALTAENSQLRDSTSERSKQPAFALVAHRSRVPEWFVAIALGSDFNCPVDRVPKVPEAIMGVQGRAGLQDSCRGSFYDLAGRVLKGQYAERNLMIPEYRIADKTLTLGAR